MSLTTVVGWDWYNCYGHNIDANMNVGGMQLFEFQNNDPQKNST